MRKVLAIGMIALIALFAVVGASFAQDVVQTTTPTAWLGVALADNADGQVIIARVQTGSPANTADVQIGDIVTAFNGEAITTASQLADLVRAAAPNSAATLEVSRAGEALTIEVTLGSIEGRPAFDPLTFAEHHLVADLEAVDGGYEVLDLLASNNPFGLEVGDVVTAVNGIAIADLSMDALRQQRMDAAADATATPTAPTITVTRAGESVTLEGALLGHHGMGDMGRGFGGRGGFGSDDMGPGGMGDRGFGGRGGFGPGGQNGQNGQAQGALNLDTATDAANQA